MRNYVDKTEGAYIQHGNSVLILTLMYDTLWFNNESK